MPGTDAAFRRVMRHRSFLRFTAALALLPAACENTAPELVIATDLAPADRPARPGGPVRWIEVAPGVDPARLAGVADLILRALPREATAGIDWRLGPVRPLVLRANEKLLQSRALDQPRSLDELDEPRWADLIALDDPRRDAPMVALATHLLDTQGWSAGYASLVRLAGHSPPIGPGGTSAARLARDEAALCLVLGTADRDGASLGGGRAFQVGVVTGSPREARARQWSAQLGPASGNEPAASASPLLPDLLGATLVDAQAELRDAIAALDEAKEADARKLAAWLGEPPPWPPASVQSLRREDPQGFLLDALAEQVAPGLEARYWLLQSWEEPAHPTDGGTLDRLATAAGGRLIREERFRAWLRADWVAWARQRYRRVARQTRSRANAPGRAS